MIDDLKKEERVHRVRGFRTGRDQPEKDVVYKCYYSSDASGALKNDTLGVALVKCRVFE